jgi:hypothetical protein
MAPAAFMQCVPILQKKSVTILDGDVFPQKKFFDQFLITAHSRIVPHIVPPVNILRGKRGRRIQVRLQLRI